MAEPQASEDTSQTETVSKVVAESSATETTSEPVKSAAVSVIQSPQPKSNGVHQEEEATEVVTNGEAAVIDQEPAAAENLDIQPPSEQLPAELLQEESSSVTTTTVASLIEQAADEEDTASPPVDIAAESSTAAPETTADKSTPVAASPEKKSAKQLASEWNEDGDEDEMEVDAPAAAAPTQPEDNKAEEPETTTEAAATAENSTQEESEQPTSTDVSPRKSGRPRKPTEKVLEAVETAQLAKDDEDEDEDGAETVEAIAAELAADATAAEDNNKKSPKKSGAKEGGGEEEGDEGKKKSKAGRPKKKDLDEKVENVMKLGNNMYFYTGPGGQDSPPPLTSDDEDLDLGLTDGPEKEKEQARKSNRAGKGRNPRLEREDEEVDIPKKNKPNLNPSWLKSAAKSIEKKTPIKTPAAAAAAAAGKTPTAAAGKKKAPETPEEPAKKTEAPATPTPAAETAQPSAETPVAEIPKDEDLPEFDPAKFTPGYVPQTVKKGNEEYMIVVQGVADTGLCGKYWGDLSNLPSRRRSQKPEILTPGTTPAAADKGPDGSLKPADDPTAANPSRGGRRGSTSSTGSTETPKRAPKKQDSPAPPKSHKKQVTKPEKPDSAKKVEVSESESETAAVATPDAAGEPEKKKRGRKRKGDTEGGESSKKAKAEEDADSSAVQSDADTESGKKKTAVPSKNAAAVSAALADGVHKGQQRSVSCVSDTSTQKEVVVECFAPYDDHRWVNIGKERDGMAPDAVQYARALRPPYHLLSFLRIKGHSTKGMSCTDKNTMVFVVLEGEITVILHTTQFNAKKGDSFYIPPKNYYNLINQKAREAELSLIQFQYDGPLPTVNPTTQPQ